MAFGDKDKDSQIQDIIEDFKQKNKLLYRWPQYFPHEIQREFDVSKIYI